MKNFVLGDLFCLGASTVNSQISAGFVDSVVDPLNGEKLTKTYTEICQKKLTYTEPLYLDE